MKLYSSKEISSFKKNIFIQGNYIHSRIYSFKEHIFVQVQGQYVHSRKLYSSNNVVFADIAKISIQKLSPGTL